MRSFRSVLPAIVAAALLGGAPSALAHAAYKSSNPPNKSTVASPPSRVSAEFTEPLTQSSFLQVFDPCGSQVDGGDTTVSGYEMAVSMSADRAGTYVVDFTAQSALDSHTTRGSFTFTSSSGEGCAGAPVAPGPPSGGGGGGGGSGGDGSGRGGAGVGPEDPVLPTAGPAAAGSGGSGGGRSAGGTSNARGRNQSPRGGGSGTTDPVAFQNTGGRAPAEEPAPWDLPLDGVVISFVLCVMIGAAGGRVYAGIVAPRRR